MCRLTRDAYTIYKFRVTVRSIDTVQSQAWIHVNGQWHSVVWAGLTFLRPNSNSVLFLRLATRGQHATAFGVYTFSKVGLLKLRQTRYSILIFYLPHHPRNLDLILNIYGTSINQRRDKTLTWMCNSVGNRSES